MKPINLAKCKIGQQVRLRDGRDYTFDGLSDDCHYPFQLKEIDNLYTKRGSYFLEGESDNDIVAILPLPKKKAKVKKMHIKFCGDPQCPVGVSHQFGTHPSCPNRPNKNGDLDEEYSKKSFF